MRIINKNKSVDEILDLILQKAEYQKVIFCLDDKSDMRFVDEISSKLGKNVMAIRYYYNSRNIEDFYNMANNGARIVIYNVSTDKFNELKIDNNFLLNIFISQSKFVLPYMMIPPSVCGDNVLVCDTEEIDYASVICLYEAALNCVWSCLVRREDVNTDIFKSIDSIVNSDKNFHVNMLSSIKRIGIEYFGDFDSCEDCDIPLFVFIKMDIICSMLNDVNGRCEHYIDFYKTEKREEDIDKAYRLVARYHVIETVRQYNDRLLILLNAILKRIKIIIKKHFNKK